MTTPDPQTPKPQRRQGARLRDREGTSPPEAPRHEASVERSFAPAEATGDLPCQVTNFKGGQIDQARAGKVLMVSAHESEVGSHNWEPFARWLVDEVAAANAAEGALILDLRRVDRLSSRGLRSLSFAWRELAPGGTIAICGLNPRLREIFAISQYDKLFEVYDDCAQAYRAVADRVRN